MAVRLRGFARAVLLMAGVSTVARSTPVDDLQSLIRDHWFWVRENEGDEVGGLSLAQMDQQAEIARRFRARLDAIPIS